MNKDKKERIKTELIIRSLWGGSVAILAAMFLSIGLSSGMLSIGAYLIWVLVFGIFGAFVYGPILVKTVEKAKNSSDKK